MPYLRRVPEFVHPSDRDGRGDRFRFLYEDKRNARNGAKQKSPRQRNAGRARAFINIYADARKSNEEAKINGSEREDQNSP